VPWWFTAGIPQDAAANDLNLYKKTLEHPNQVVSTSVIRSFSRHTWYLAEEMIALSLFSDNITIAEKVDVVTKLNSF